MKGRPFPVHRPQNLPGCRNPGSQHLHRHLSIEYKRPFFRIRTPGLCGALSCSAEVERTRNDLPFSGAHTTVLDASRWLHPPTLRVRILRGGGSAANRRRQHHNDQGISILPISAAQQRLEGVAFQGAFSAGERRSKTPSYVLGFGMPLLTQTPERQQYGL